MLQYLFCQGKTCSTPHVTNKGADQPGHLCQRNGRQQTTISLFTIVHVPYTHPIRGGDYFFLESNTILYLTNYCQLFTEFKKEINTMI